MWSFLGKSYIVSGGLSGIGLNTTLRLATRGAHVWVADISTNTPAEIREHPASSNIHLSKTPVDIRSLEECRNLTEAVVKQHGRLDGLVNCAGICLAEPAIGSRELHEVFQKEFDINVRGTFNLGTEVLSLMQGQDVHSLAGRGSIVNIGSIAAQQGIAGLSVYCMSKHAILGLTRAWAQDWAAKQIRVNAVAPGVTRTPMSDELLSGNVAQSLIANIPMGRVARAEDISSTILFLLSDQASYTTGQILTVAGGT